MGCILDFTLVQRWVVRVGSYRLAAERAGLKVGHLNKIANGKQTDLSISTLGKLAVAMGVAPEKLLRSDDVVVVPAVAADSEKQKTKVKRLQEFHARRIERLKVRHKLEMEKEKGKHDRLTRKETAEKFQQWRNLVKLLVVANYTLAQGDGIEDGIEDAIMRAFKELGDESLDDPYKVRSRSDYRRNFCYSDAQFLLFDWGKGECPECHRVGDFVRNFRLKVKERGHSGDYFCGCSAHLRVRYGKLIFVVDRIGWANDARYPRILSKLPHR